MEASPDPPQGPIRDAAAALAEQQAQDTDRAVALALAAYLDRIHGVTRSRMRGPTARRGTRWWQDGSGAPPPNPKAVDATYVVPAKLVGKIDSALRPVMQRVAAEVAAETAKRLGVDGDIGKAEPFAVDEAELRRAVDEAMRILDGVATRYAEVIRAEVLAADTDADTLERVLERIDEAYRKGGGRLLMAGRTVGTALRHDVALSQARALGVTHSQWLCVAADTEVWASGAINVARRWSTEGLLRITTDQGVGAGGKLSVTPDHPMLTNRGWIAARELHPGDYLIRSLLAEGGAGGHPDEQRVPAKIFEVFGAAHQVGTTQRMMRTTVNLDSDGSSGYVDVVAVDGKLRDRLQPTISKPTAQQFFTYSDLDLEFLLLNRAIDHVRIGLSATDVEGSQECLTPSGDFSRFMRYSVEASLGAIAPRDTASLNDASKHSGAYREFLPYQPGRCTCLVCGDHDILVKDSASPASTASGAGLVATAGAVKVPSERLDGGEQNVSAPQPPPDGFSADVTEALGDLSGSLAGLIAADKIIDIKLDPTPTHVYDLQTATGWFMAGGYVVHNSRRDATVRATHRKADGQVRLLDDRFRVGAFRLRYPGDPADLPESWPEVANCRCGLLLGRPDPARIAAANLISAALGRRGANPAAEAVLGAARGGDQIPVPSGVDLPGPATRVRVPRDVVGYRALTAASDASVGQWLTLAAPVVLALLAATTATQLAVAIPAGTALTVVGGALVLDQTALEVIGTSPQVTATRVAT